MPDVAPENPPCPQCKGAAHRIKRVGLVQTLFFPLFKRYPWRCAVCGASFSAPNRGKLKRKRRDSGEFHLPPVS